MPVMVFLVGILSGVALRSIVKIPQLMIAALVCACVFSLIYCLILSRKKLIHRITFLLTLFLCAMAIGIIRYDFNEKVFHSQAQAFRGELEFEGVIDEIPTKSEYNISARTKVDYGYVLLRIQKGSEIAYGDRLLVVAECEIPEDFETNTGSIFKYKDYLMARGVHHVCKVSSFEVIEKHAGGMLQEKLYTVRLWFSGHIDEVFKKIHAGLIKGVLLGDKSGLGQELKNDMTVAGVIHIAVLSGSNIAVLAAIIFGLFKRFHYHIRIVTTVTAVILFVLLSGAEPPAVRAGILVAALFLGKFLHRNLHTGKALLLIAVTMIWWNPFALIYDMSFQLSFLATIGIVYIAPLFEKLYKKVPEYFGLREAISSTCGAQAAVTPLLLYSTGAFSIVSLPANVLIGWAVPLLMIVGFFGGVLHIISDFVALPAVILGEGLSSYIIFITKVAAHIPWAQIIF